MKVTVKNLGVIRDEVTIDLKPLTIFIGPNNSGKTWLAYTLAGILGPYGSERYIQAYTEETVPTIYEPLNKAISDVLNEGSATINLRQFAELYGESYFNEVAGLAPNWLGEFFSTQLAHFEETRISFHLDEQKKHFLQRVSLYARVRSNIFGPMKSLLTIQKKRGEDIIRVYTTTEIQDVESQEEQVEEIKPTQQITDLIPPEAVGEVRERLVNFVTTALYRSLYSQIRVFPTERTALITGRISKGMIGEITSRMEQAEFNPRNLKAFAAFEDALNALVRELDGLSLGEQDEVRNAIWPVGTFIGMLGRLLDMRIVDQEARERSARSSPRIRRYINLAEILEKQILFGDITFSTPEPDPRREVLFQPLPNVNLEIPIASSMAKELAPLVLYLRYLAQPGELVIIDEPEMNLHPAAQAKIIEFLAMLVNAGLHVLFTTHSPYITDHLTNLIKACELGNEDKERVREAFFLQRTEAFIAKDKVSVYGFHDGKVENVLDEDGFVNWSTFGSISDRISELYFKL
jgi:ABC-type multidrug transport system ATPase subunit